MNGFQIANSTFGMKLGGVDYRFPHVVEIQFEDPERVNLTRGANNRTSTGIPFVEGLREPKRMTIPLIAMPLALKVALETAHKDQARLDVYCIDNATGSYMGLSEALVANRPIQLTVDESADSMNVSVEFVSFIVKYDIKEA